MCLDLLPGQRAECNYKPKRGCPNPRSCPEPGPRVVWRGCLSRGAATSENGGRQNRSRVPKQTMIWAARGSRSAQCCQTPSAERAAIPLSALGLVVSSACGPVTLLQHTFPRPSHRVSPDTGSCASGHGIKYPPTHLTDYAPIWSHIVPIETECLGPPSRVILPVIFSL